MMMFLANLIMLQLRGALAGLSPHRQTPGIPGRTDETLKKRTISRGILAHPAAPGPKPLDLCRPLLLKTR